LGIVCEERRGSSAGRVFVDAFSTLQEDFDVGQDLPRGFNLVSTRYKRRHQFGPGVLAAHRLGYGLSPCIQRDCPSQYELRTSDQFELRDASNVEVCDPFTSSSAANASPSWPCCAAFTCAAYLKAIVQDQPSLALTRRRRRSSRTVMAPLRMSDNRTVSILRKAHDEGYGVLAQVIYDFQMRDL
jgi:hypothetical protein